MRSLFNSKNVSDYELIAEGRSIYVQQCFLEAKMGSSNYLHAHMINNRESGSSFSGQKTRDIGGSSSGAVAFERSIVIIPDIPYDILYCVILFLYTGEFEVDADARSLAHVLVLSERFGLTNLLR